MRPFVRCVLLLAATGLPSPVVAQPTKVMGRWQVGGILSALDDANLGVRQRALEHLNTLLRPESQVPEAAQEQALNVPEDVRVDLVRKIGSTLKVPDARVRLRAARVLGSLGRRKEAADTLILLLKDPDANIRLEAAQSLGGLQAKEAVPALIPLLKDPGTGVGLAAARALGRLGAKEAAADIIPLLEHPDDGVRLSAAWALRELGAKEAVPALRPLLKDPDTYVRLGAACALGELGEHKDKEAAAAVLLRLLKHFAADIRLEAARTLGEMGKHEEAAADIIPLLKQPVVDSRLYAAWALGELGKHKEAAAAFIPLLKYPDPRVRGSATVGLGRLGKKESASFILPLLKDPDASVRLEAARALGKLAKHEKVAASLRSLFKDPDTGVRLYAAWALGELAKHEEAAAFFIPLLKDPDASVRLGAAEVLSRVRGTSALPLLAIPYEDTDMIVEARWLARYWSGGDKRARVRCDYLGRPSKGPAPPANLREAREVLEALKEVWEQPTSRYLREDAAAWVAFLITRHLGEWEEEDVDRLRWYGEQFTKDTENQRIKSHAAVIREELNRLTPPPPPPWWERPWARTLLAVALVNFVAFLVLRAFPGRKGLPRWLPFVSYAVAGLGSGIAALLAPLHLNLWLLYGLLVGELVVLIALGTVSVAMLREFARVEPLSGPVVLLALRLPWSRGRLFRYYADRVESALEEQRRQTIQEQYVPLPAESLARGQLVAAAHDEPAKEIEEFLTTPWHPPGSDPVPGRALIQAPSGRGKSALLREVVKQALVRFKEEPGKTPLPVLLARDTDDILAKVQQGLGDDLLVPELLHPHLKAGDFLLVLDGLTESKLLPAELEKFIHSSLGRQTPLLLSSRPNSDYSSVIRQTTRWRTVEPLRLDDRLLDKFVEGYQAPPLSDSLRRVCRGHDGTYLPILVRLAINLPGRDQGWKNAADIYYQYFLHLLEKRHPDEKERVGLLKETSRWCLQTYWKDGVRTLRYQPEGVLPELLQANILVRVEGVEPQPPRTVRFFHDSMQSYLTAYGLHLQDDEGYSNLPRPAEDTGDAPWDRRRVLWRMLTAPEFTGATSDLLLEGGSELYQMFLAAFQPAEPLRRFFDAELQRWGDDEEQGFPKRKVLAAVPEGIRPAVEKTRNGRNLLRKARELCREADEGVDGADNLGRLYAGIVPLIQPPEDTDAGAA